MTAVSLRAFGLPDVSADGRPIRLNLRKALALLVYVAEARGAVGRETLAALLWPEASDEVARARLRRTLHRIELAFGCGVFEADRVAIAMAPTIALTLDTRLFEEACERGVLTEACRLYRGDFLEGFALDECRELEDWAFFRREALRGRLVQSLERLVQDAHAASNHAAAIHHARRLVALDPLSESYGRHLIRSLLMAGDRAGAERHHAELTQRLRDELGVAPEPATTALLARSEEAHAAPAVRYVEGQGAHLAYCIHGAGDIDILVMPGFVSHVERVWDHPSSRAFLMTLMTHGRLITFDRRGVGLSDRVGLAPTVDVTADDIGTVLRACASRRVILFGASEGGPACIKFAVDHPGLVAGLVLFGSLAKGSRAPDYPHALNADQYETWRRHLVAEWGGPAGLEIFGPSLARDPQAKAWWAGLLRAASSPGAICAVLDALRDTDVRQLLPRLAVPTLVLHRRGDRAVRLDAGRDMASRISGARFVALDGDDHWFFAGDQKPVLAEIGRFIGELSRGASRRQ